VTDESTVAVLNGRADIVIANPPYVPDNKDLGPDTAGVEPDLALWGGGPEGLDKPRQFLMTAARLLRPGGSVVLEHDARQGYLLRKTAFDSGFFEGPRTRKDLAGKERYLEARRTDRPWSAGPLEPEE
jgi:release factor glutamine methyltransferase